MLDKRGRRVDFEAMILVSTPNYEYCIVVMVRRRDRSDVSGDDEVRWRKDWVGSG